MPTSINTIRRSEGNITAYQGDTLSLTLTFTDDNDDPLDFTGVTFKMQIRKKDGTLMQTLTQGTDITVTQPNIVVLSSIINIEKGCYEYDLQGTYSNNTVVTFLGGSFDVTKQITV
jgi:hypothetical protein